jgi:hypothetical protein
LTAEGEAIQAELNQLNEVQNAVRPHFLFVRMRAIILTSVFVFVDSDASRCWDDWSVQGTAFFRLVSHNRATTPILQWKRKPPWQIPKKWQFSAGF